MTATLRFDGGRRPSINTAAYGFTLTDGGGNLLTRSAQAIGNETHNVAEYRGLIAGLSRAAELGITDLEVRGDSRVVVCQMSGEWKVKATHLAALRDEARRVASRIGKVEYIWNGRGDNSEADQLVNLALDGHKMSSLPTVPAGAAPLLRRILEAVERGELTAPGPMIAHLKGALAALEALERPAQEASSSRLTQ